MIFYHFLGGDMWFIDLLNLFKYLNIYNVGILRYSMTDQRDLYTI